MNRPAADFHRLRQNLDRAFGDAGDGLARGELGVEMGDGRAAFGFRKQNGVGLARHHGVEIGVGHAGLEAVDAHQRRGRSFLPLALLRNRQRRLPRHVLALGRNRILEIEDHRIGATAERLVELGPAVGGNEQERTHR